jgi:hypothetical protein
MSNDPSRAVMRRSAQRIRAEAVHTRVSAVCECKGMPPFDSKVDVQKTGTTSQSGAGFRGYLNRMRGCRHRSFKASRIWRLFETVVSQPVRVSP